MKPFLAAMICLCFVLPALALEGAGTERFVPGEAEPYSDVAEDAWYHDTVMAATGAGLVSGRGDGSFDPDGPIRLSEAVKLAAVIHNIYGGGDGNIGEDGDTWYQRYVDYAVVGGIISYSDFTGFDAYATRAQVAGILARALPESELEPVNAAAALPDVSEADRYGEEIFLLYRAGVLVGDDEYGTFRPDASIRRSEAATLAARLTLLVPRERFTPKELPPLDALEESIAAMLDGLSGVWSVYVRDLESGASFTINDTPMMAASVVKLFIAASAYEAVENGSAAMTPALDGHMSSMLSYSSEDSTDAVLRAIGGGVKAAGKDIMTDWCAENGYLSSGYLFLDRVRFTTRVTSARDCGELLTALYEGRLVSESASESMLGHLKNQRVTHKIPAALPVGTVTANKTGELSGDYDVENDAAIVWAPSGAYILTVLSNGASPSLARANIKSISALVYEFMETN